MKPPHLQIPNQTLQEMEKKKKEKSAKNVHKPIVPFSNRLKSNKISAQMGNIFEMFNQAKTNVPLLDAI